MFTFLKEEYKKQMAGEYQRRLLTVGLRLLALAAIMLVIGSLPSYFSLKSQRKALEVEEKAFSEKMVQTGQAESEADVKLLADMVSAVKADAATAPLASLIQKAISKKGSDIAISSLGIERKKDGWAVSLGGKAASRDSLVAFSKSLSDEPGFSAVDLPVSSLAKSKDISFSISLRSKF